VKNKFTSQNLGIWLGGVRTPANKKRKVMRIGSIIIATAMCGEAALKKLNK
jgi:hypothetical protein